MPRHTPLHKNHQRHRTNTSQSLGQRLKTLERRVGVSLPLRSTGPSYRASNKSTFRRRALIRRRRNAVDRRDPYSTTVSNSEVHPTPVRKGLNIYRVKPGDSGFLFLDHLGSLFELYSFETQSRGTTASLQVHFKPAASTTTSGDIIVGVDYHTLHQIRDRTDVQGLAQTKVCSMYEPLTINIRPGETMKNRPYQAFVRRNISPEFGGNMLATAFILYVYVDTNSDLDVLGNISFQYTIRVSGFNVNTSETRDPVAVVETPTLPLAVETVTAHPSMAVVEYDDPEDPEIAIVNASDELMQDGSDLGAPITTAQLPQNLEVGDLISVISTDLTAERIRSLMQSGALLYGDDSILLPKGIRITKPKVTFRYPSGKIIPDTVIQPLNSKPKINGNFERMTTYSNTKELTSSTNIASLESNDFFGDIFKVIQPLARSLLPESLGPLVDIVGGLVLYTGEKPIVQLPKDRIDIDMDFCPHITAVGMGTNLDVTVHETKELSILEYLNFGGLFKITGLTPSGQQRHMPGPAQPQRPDFFGESGASLEIHTLNSDYTIIVSGNASGDVQFKPRTPELAFHTGENITCVITACVEVGGGLERPNCYSPSDPDIDNVNQVLKPSGKPSRATNVVDTATGLYTTNLYSTATNANGITLKLLQSLKNTLTDWTGVTGYHGTVLFSRVSNSHREAVTRDNDTSPASGFAKLRRLKIND